MKITRESKIITHNNYNYNNNIIIIRLLEYKPKQLIKVD